MPNFEITSPDGRKFQVTAPDGASQEDVLAYAQKNMPQPQQAATKPEPTLGQSIASGDVGGAAGNILSGIGADTADVAKRSFDAGTTAVANSFGQLDPGTREARYQENVAKNGPVMGTLKDMFVDTPGELGNALSIPGHALGVLSSLMMGPIHGTAGRLIAQLPGMDKPQADQLIDRAMSFVAPATMKFGLTPPPGSTIAENIASAPGNARSEVQAANAQATAQNPMLAQARQAGYVVHPAEAGTDSFVSNTAAQIGGKTKTQQAAAIRNQEITNSIAARELGLPADATLDETAFEQVRADQANAYKAISNSANVLPGGRVMADNQYFNDISGLDSKSADFVQDFPEAAAKRSEAVKGVQDQVLKQSFSPQAGVEMIRNLRDDARANLKNWTDTDKVRTGMAQRDAANAIEDLIDRQLSAAGNPDAVANYRAARQTIAKSHDIESVTNSAGDVDARKLAALGQKRPLSGGLKVISDTASAFPKSMQSVAKVGGPEKRSVIDTGWSLGNLGAAVGAAAHGNIPLAASMTANAALPYLRPLARDLALSDGVQNGLLGLRQQPGNMGPMLKAGALPTAVGANSLTELQREIARLFSRTPPQQQQ